MQIQKEEMETRFFGWAWLCQFNLYNSADFFKKFVVYLQIHLFASPVKFTKFILKKAEKI